MDLSELSLTHLIYMVQAVYEPDAPSVFTIAGQQEARAFWKTLTEEQQSDVLKQVNERSRT